MAQCMSPYTLKDTNTGVQVPCGKCADCRKRRVSAWSFRLMQEDKVSLSSLFITLTYNTDHVPILKSGYMSLNKSDLQKFFKRLRKLETNKVRYYACGEYGGKTFRPHYHIILFNASVNSVISAWSLDGKPLGSVHFGVVSEASVGYTLKYISKKPRIPQHQNDDREREFSLMSKGLGANYLSPTMIAYHREERALKDRMHCVLLDGKKIAMPRYYKDKLYSTLQRTTAGVELLKESKLRTEKEEQKMIDKFGYSEWERIKMEKALLKQTKMSEYDVGKI
nr:MAG: replication initiator protein [Microvirus sp.]